jgi:hypothetical protein
MDVAGSRSRALHSINAVIRTVCTAIFRDTPYASVAEVSILDCGFFGGTFEALFVARIFGK